MSDIDISDNNIKKDGAIKMAEALMINKALTIFGKYEISDIGFNKIGPNGAAQIADAIAHSKTLASLGISYDTHTYAVIISDVKVAAKLQRQFNIIKHWWHYVYA